LKYFDAIFAGRRGAFEHLRELLGIIYLDYGECDGHILLMIGLPFLLQENGGEKNRFLPTAAL
jgi:hypothetical protein